MMKKITAILLSVLMIVSAFGMISFAAGEADKPFANSEFYEIGDYSIHYRQFPVDNAKGQIFMIHGFGLSTYTFEFIIPELNAMGYSCVAADVPSFGYSTREDFSTNQISREELMYSLMTSLNDESWILAGHSMGGGVSLNIACENDLEALMLFCPSEIYMQGNSMLTNLATNSVVSKMMDSIFKMVLSSDLIVKAAVYMTTGDMEYAKNYDASLLADPLMIPGTGAGMLLASANAKNTDMEALSAIDTPTLLVWANGDNVISADIVSEVTAALPEAELQNVDGSHIVIETDPDTLAEISLTFLAK